MKSHDITKHRGTTAGAGGVSVEEQRRIIADRHQLLVIDASEGVAGGCCTRLLAGLGADVVKIERPRTGDRLRHAGPFVGDVPHVETSIPHLHLNAGKRSITLDAETATGGRLLLSLLGRAEVLVLDERARLHTLISEPEIGQRFPMLVVATITPFGSCAQPPASNKQQSASNQPGRSLDIVEQALGGYLLMTGDPDREPVKPYGEQASYQAGLHAALGITAALAARDRLDSGGQVVDVAATEAVAFLVGGALQRWHFFGREATRDGSRTVGMAPNFLYPSTIRPCRDGYVHAHVHNRFPDLLAALLEEPRLADGDLLATARGHADEIDALMDPWLARRDKWAAVDEAQELRIPFAEVLDPSEVMEDRFGQHAARGFFAEIEHPVAGKVIQLGPPIRMSSELPAATRAPLLGEHNASVFRGELGLSGRDLARLSAAGVI